MNVPDYPKLAQLWWQNIGDAMSGAKTPKEALDGLCQAQEQVLERLERAARAGVLAEEFAPALNEPRDPEYWLSQEGSPKAQLADEDPQPVTVSYDELVKSWQESN